MRQARQFYSTEITASLVNFSTGSIVVERAHPIAPLREETEGIDVREVLSDVGG
jgi:hypothetical protein